MTTPASYALVSPRDCRTARLVGHTEQSLTGLKASCEGTEFAISEYLKRYPTTEFVRVTSESDVIHALKVSRERTCTLDYCLMLFDDDLSMSLKQRVAAELDTLLDFDDYRHYALDIVLAYPLPHTTDFATAHAAAQGFRNSAELVRLLESTRERAEFARNAWLRIRGDGMIIQRGQEYIKGSLVLAGAFSAAVLRLTTSKSGDDGTRYSILSDCQKFVDPRVTSLFLDAYLAQLPQGVVHPMPESIVEHEKPLPLPVHNDDLSRTFRPRHTSTRADIALGQAVKQVEEIVRLYMDGKDAQARRIQDQLVASQADEATHSHLVKSLSNIAKKCSDGGRNDIAAECLTLAQDYPRGVDSRLFSQIGALLKDLRRYEQAVFFYSKALAIASSTEERDGIAREFARLLTLQGRYQEAIDAFLQLDDIASSPESRTSLAVAYRKIGNLSLARDIFRNVWTSDKYPNALAGLAEVNRQTGRLDKAIAKYSFLVRNHDLDPRSHIVYELARSSLFMATGQPAGSHAILCRLYQAFSNVPSVQFAMAKSHLFLGNTVRANELFRSSRQHLQDADRLAASLYDTALLAHGLRHDLNDDVPSVTPDFRLLESCNSLLRKIIMGNALGDSLGSLASLTLATPYKSHSDFAAVLNYHALLVVDSNVNVANPFALSVNRIRKRGLPLLRDTVRALDNRDFATAIFTEAQFCLAVC